ncbi:MAG: HEAT repeat domain-containing protein [Candidatus Heimdallarchaeota archaeon]
MNKTSDDYSPITESLAYLIQTLKNDPDWNKRFGAASKLYRLGQETAIDPLIFVLQNDKHKEMQRFAADLLGRLEDPRATWALIASFRQAIIEKNANMMQHTSDALIRLKSPDLFKLISGTLEDKDEMAIIKLRFIELLGKMGDTKSIELLIQIIRNKATKAKIRGKCIEELVYTGHLAGLQLILELLDVTSNKNFQKIVVRALGKTPFKNKTIIIRISDSLLKITEYEESKQEKKDKTLQKLVITALKNLAKNINMDFDRLMDKVLIIRKKQHAPTK